MSPIIAEGWRVGADLGIFGFGAKVEKKNSKNMKNLIIKCSIKKNIADVLHVLSLIQLYLKYHN